MKSLTWESAPDIGRRARTPDSLNLHPAEIILIGSNLKMILHDSQVHIEIRGHREQGPGLHHIVRMENEHEFLLVCGCRGQKRRLHTFIELLGRKDFGLVEVIG